MNLKSEKILAIARQKEWTDAILLSCLLEWFDDREDSEVGPAPGEMEITRWLEDKS